MKSHAQAKAGEATVDVGSIVSVGLADTYRRTLAEATNVSYRWYTTDSEISVVTYSKTYAEVKGLKPTSSARVYFTASYYIDGWYRTMDFYYTITVESSTIYVSSIYITPSELSMTEGETKSLSASVYPTNATYRSVKWETSNYSVASVSSTGIVTGNSQGVAYITCSAKDGSGVYKTCKVTVNSSEPTSFSAYTAEGVLVNYKNIGNKTCEIYGDSFTPAIASNTQSSVTIPSSVNGYKVVSISDYAFYNCSGLTSVTIPSSVTTIGCSTFSGCKSLTNITIPNSVTSIRKYAFYHCSGLTSVTIPSSVTSIGNSAFDGCKGLTSITIPNSVTSIDIDAFHGCSSLTSITIPNSVTTIGDEAFSGCKGLTSIKVDAKNSKYDSRENCNAIIETSTNTLIAGCKNTIIPNSVTTIGETAFFGCSGLTSINIPSSVTSIGDYAFWYCSGLTSINIPSSVTSIGNSAFDNCSGLTGIKVDAGNSKYDSRDNCNAIIETSSNTLIAGCKNTIIPEDIKSIGNSAFDGCSGLTSISIPSSVTSIGNAAFYYCEGLTSITIPSSVTNIGNMAFGGCSGLKSIYSYITSPTSSTGSNFNSSHYTNATLYVPKGTKTLYQNTDGWKKFQNIVEFDASAVQKVSGEETEAKVTGYYFIDGKRLSQPQKGLNIIRMSDGTTRKVVK